MKLNKNNINRDKFGGLGWLFGEGGKAFFFELIIRI